MRIVFPSKRVRCVSGARVSLLIIGVFTIVERDGAEPIDELRSLLASARAVDRFEAVFAKRCRRVQAEHAIALFENSTIVVLIRYATDVIAVDRCYFQSSTAYVRVRISRA